MGIDARKFCWEINGTSLGNEWEINGGNQLETDMI